MTDPTGMQPPIRFTPEELKLFSRASYDTNPLHLSAEFARRTPYGQQVVFGVLGVVAGLGRLQRRVSMALSKLNVDFPNPMFMEVDYRVAVEDDGGEKGSVKLYDGNRLVCRMTASFQPTIETTFQAALLDRRHREEAADWADSDFKAGLSVEQSYQPEPAALAGLMSRFELGDKGVTPFQVGILLWSSYLIGMELPGRRALFSRLSLDFLEEIPGEGAPFQYRARLQSFDERYSILSLRAELKVEGSTVAQGTLQSFVNRSARGAANRDMLLDGKLDSRFRGKTALVIGGSRGLGGAIAQTLALAGCSTLATYVKGREQAEQLRDELPDEGTRARLRPVQCDGSNAAGCREVRGMIAREYGTLDFLVCNASPPLLPLWLEDGSLERIGQYLEKAIGLYAVPLATFLASVTPKTGWVVVISSIAVEDPPADWPHYVAAKRAIEGLIEVAAKEYPQLHFLIVRPPRLLTDLTNTPLGRHQALMPEQVALKIAERMQRDGRVGAAEILRDFTSTAMSTEPVL